MAGFRSVVAICCLLGILHAVHSVCPVAWYSRAGGKECFRVEDGLFLEYKHAQERCHGLNAHLALPYDMEDWVWLRDVLLKYCRTPRFWLGIDNVDGQWKDWNGTAFDIKDMPWTHNMGKSQNVAAFMEDGQVMEASVNAAMGIVCQRAGEAPLRCDTEGWENFSDYCYEDDNIVYTCRLEGD